MLKKRLDETKKVCLELLAKARSRWDYGSLMSVGSAFQARGPAIEKALSVTWRWVRKTTKLPHTHDRSRVSSQRRTSSESYCGAVYVISWDSSWLTQPLPSYRHHKSICLEDKRDYENCCSVLHCVYYIVHSDHWYAHIVIIVINRFL